MPSIVSAPTFGSSKPAEHNNSSYVPADTLLRNGSRFISTDSGASARTAFGFAKDALDAFNDEPSVQSLISLARQVGEARECAYVYAHMLDAERAKPDAAVYDTAKEIEQGLQRPETIRLAKDILNPLKKQALADVETARCQLLQVSQQMGAASADRPQHIDWCAEYRSVSMEHDLARTRASYLAQISHMLLGPESNSRL